MTKIDTKEAISLFFTEILGEEANEKVFKCSCGIKRKQRKGTGFSNLMSHLREKHPNWEEMLTQFKKENPKAKKAPKGHVFFVNPKAVLLHQWMDLVVSANLPLSIVENRSLRGIASADSISEDTLSKYLKLVEAQIDKKLKSELPTKFGIVIDGWSEGTTHYFGVFAAYSKNEKKFQRFLTIAPPFDETSFTADAQAAFIVDVVELLDRQKTDILFLVADNTNTNPRTAEILNVPFIGCASHRFNLAVQRYLSQYEAIISDINQLMKSLFTLKRAGKLRQLTHLEPIFMNVTRWSSKFTMIDRYFRLEESIKAMNDAELNVLIPSGRQLMDLKRLQKDMQKFERVTLKLQNPSITLLTVRDIFDETVKQYPTMAHYLAKDAIIVKNPVFETAICKLITDSTSKLNVVEEQLLAPFLRNPSAVQDDVSGSDIEQDIVKAVEKRRKVERGRYNDLAYIPPTSNACERLFSAAR